MENELKTPASTLNNMTPAEYLEAERAADYKNEFYDGYVYPLAGASLHHNIIIVNLLGHLFDYLKGSAYEVLSSNMRVGTPSRNAYMYPDLSVTFGEPLLEDDHSDTLLKPSVVIEILSPFLRGIHRENKFAFYQQIPSLKEYVMIDSMKRYVIASRRQSGGSWVVENIHANAIELPFHTIGFSLTLQKIYNGTGI